MFGVYDMTMSMSTIWLILWMVMAANQEQIPDEDAILNCITKKEKPIVRATLVMGKEGSGETTLAILLTGGDLYRKRDFASNGY